LDAESLTPVCREIKRQTVSAAERSTHDGICETESGSFGFYFLARNLCVCTVGNKLLSFSDKKKNQSVHFFAVTRFFFALEKK
jgi:hypothetical protein